MSGVEVIGLISAITSIIDAAAKIYSAARDASGLPSEFRVVAQSLPLVKNTLQAAHNGLEDNANPECVAALTLVLEGCKKKAASLEQIFQLIRPTSSASKFQRLLPAIRALGKGKQVETLMKGIMDDIQLMAGNRALTATTRARVTDLVEGQRPGGLMAVSNHGPGVQSVHLGKGEQNINTGSGPQFNRGTFRGNVNFSAPARA